MKYSKKMIGKRVYLSPMSIEDAEIYVKWLNDFNVTDGLGTSNNIISVESEKEWISQNTSKYQLAIIRLEDDMLIGNCGLQEIDHIRQCGVVGLFFGEEENRSKGYGQEVLNLLLNYGFEYLNLNNIMLKVFSFNERAINCYTKVGFKEIGRRRQSYYLKGRYWDEVYMDILKQEFMTKGTIHNDI
ncbi:RimJ/RimL family protein N-acetyltransferase [Sedimentibacter acidaminivorans]|uniref:RimJ/RimL family protein N-acetyltransferase n=1 Tax=Sedimentibacter acidaminivorans TaxID=913099 RepID=A0ABS4GCQ6_9FIRM|nr:GNAT family protein [Sedimentibacter acidaminivorans]MBP1925317.1 RimJ/RimL family protein N-acetyltransferase [Sedimentibacter acidaminivorans]